MNDAGPQEAAGLLSVDIIQSSRDVDYICQPFTYRAHQVVSIVEQPDGTFLARVRTLFKPFNERAYVFYFKKEADSYLAYRVDNDRFTQEGEAATDAVRRFIFAAKAGNWDLASRYASPHLPIDEMKTPAWERYLSRINRADPEGQVSINADHGIMLGLRFSVKDFEDPDFLVDPLTGKIVRAFYKIGTTFTNLSSPPNDAGITDPDIESYTLLRFGLGSAK